jgi:hypothetical protein
MEQVTSSATADLGQLNEVCRGTQLRSLTEGWTRSRAHGIVSVGSVKSNVVEAKISNDRAYLVDELDLSHWLLAHGETGAPVEGQYVNPECAAYEVVLAKDDGQWFVTEIADLGPCG